MAYDSNIILQGFLENNDHQIIAVDLNYNYIIFNGKYRKIMKAVHGLDIKPGMNSLDHLLLKAERKMAKDALDETFKGGNFILIEEYCDDNLLKSYFEHYYYPLKEDGKIWGAALFIKDVSASKKIELRKEEYISLLENVIYKISHEMRQPIAQILGLAQVINYEKYSKEEILNITRLFKISTSKLDDFTREMMEFIHRHNIKKKIKTIKVISNDFVY